MCNDVFSNDIGPQLVFQLRLDNLFKDAAINTAQVSNDCLFTVVQNGTVNSAQFLLLFLVKKPAESFKIL